MSAKRYHSSRSAFTLIELVTVIAVLAVMAVFVGGPTLSHINDMRSSAAASRLASDIRYIQRLALGSGMRTWVVFDVAGNRYSLHIEDPAKPGKAGRLAVTHPLDQTTNAVQFGVGPFAGVSISQADFNSTVELEFDSFGVPYDASGSALTSSGHTLLSNNIAVEVHPVGGFVEHRSWP